MKLAAGYNSIRPELFDDFLWIRFKVDAPVVDEELAANFFEVKPADFSKGCSVCCKLTIRQPYEENRVAETFSSIIRRIVSDKTILLGDFWSFMDDLWIS